MNLQWPVDLPFQDLYKGNLPWEIRSSYWGDDYGSGTSDMISLWLYVMWKTSIGTGVHEMVNMLLTAGFDCT